MKCKEIRWLLALYGSGELSSEEQEMAETHLASCERCRQELSRLSEVPALIQSLHSDTWWADVSSPVMESLRASGVKSSPLQAKPAKAEKKGVMTGTPFWRPVRIGSLAAAIIERPIWQRALVTISAFLLIALASSLLMRPWEGNNISQLALDLAQNNSQVQTMLGEGVPETEVVLMDGIARVKFGTEEVFITVVVNIEDMRVMAMHREALTFQPPGPPTNRSELTENEKNEAVAIAENDPYVLIFLRHGFNLGEPNSSHPVLGEDTRRVAWLPLEGMVSDEYSGVIVNLDDYQDVTVMWGGELPDWWPFT